MAEVEIVDAGGSSYDGIGETIEDWQVIAAIGVITTGGTNDQASEQSGISLRTLYRLKKLPRWKDAEREIHADMIGNARAAIIGMVAKARKAIEEVIDSPDLKGSPTKLAAALSVLDRATHIMPDMTDKEIRRIISRVPRSAYTPPIPAEEAEQLPATPPAPLDAPEHYGIPASPQVRESVRQRRINAVRQVSEG